MTAPAAHSVQVESEPMTVSIFRWHCATGGTEEDGYTRLQDAEAAADAHGTNS